MKHLKTPQTPVNSRRLMLAAALAVFMLATSASAAVTDAPPAMPGDMPLPAPIGTGQPASGGPAGSGIKPPDEGTADPLAWTAPSAPPSTPAAPAPPAAAPVEAKPAEVKKDIPDTAALEARLSALEKQIQDLKQESVAKADFESLKGTVSDLQKARDEKPAPVAVPKTVKKSLRRAPKKSAGSSHVSSRWILKSAKPGIAWVAEPGSSELHTVSVGEKLSGVGEVTAIARDSTGKWVVVGTQGRISQSR
jgi:hypothetical protein